MKFNTLFRALAAAIATMMGTRLLSDGAMAASLNSNRPRPHYGSGPRPRIAGPAMPAGSKLARKAAEGKL